MAKSTGDFLTLKGEFADKNINPLVYRFATFGVHYRKKMEWNSDIETAALNGYNNLINKIKILGITVGEINMEIKERFIDNINDDLNMPKALATVGEIFKYGISNEDKLATIIDLDKVLGLNLYKIPKESEGNIPEEVIILIKERELARKEKNWDKSDELRKKINELGYEIKDTDSETKISKI